jgi:L-alanine-DL-glutamate epimerase-like enolase superfamily enzyme
VKITSIEVFKVDIPLKDPMRSGFLGHSWNQVKNVVVRIATDNDYVGYGSTTPVPPYHGMTQGMILEACQLVAPLLIGEDPTALARIHDLMDRAIVRADPAKCAVDLALYDLLGRYANLPAWALIGGRRRETFPTTWTLPTGRDKAWTHEETVAEARLRYDMGYRGFEVHLGASPGSGFEQDLVRIAAVKDALPDVAIDADVHRNWTVKEAISAIRALEKYNIWIEQPCENLRQLAEVRRQVTAGIIADESCQNVYDLVDIVSQGAADGICLKPIKAGGLYPAWQMATIAERFGLAVRVDGIPGESILSNTASAHVAMALKQPIVCGVMQHSRLEFDIVTSGGLQFKDGLVTLPDTPGLGCEVSEESFQSAGYFN